MLTGGDKVLVMEENERKRHCLPENVSGTGTFMNASGASNPELRGAFPWLSNNGAPCGIAPWVAACPPSPAPAPNAGPDALLGPAPAELEAGAWSPSECPLLARPEAVMYSSGRTNQARGYVAVRFSAGYASEACAPECVFEVRCQDKCDPLSIKN